MDWPPKLSTSTPADDDLNPIVNPRHITNDGSKQALRVHFVGPKKLKDDPRYSEEYE
jgi:hypothetical protein